MAPWAHALAESSDVTLPVLASHEEMKYRPVVPQHMAPHRLKGGYVLMYESDRCGGRSQALAKPRESGGRHIQHSQITVPRGEQLVDEEGSPGTDVYYGIRRPYAGRSNELQGFLRTALIPTDLGGGLPLVHRIPVALARVCHDAKL